MDSIFNEAMSRSIQANLALKTLYCFSLFFILPISLFGASGWLGMMTGGGFLPAPILMWLLLIVWRLVYVVRYRNALDSLKSNKFLFLLRKISILLMVVGIMASLTIFIRRPITEFVFRNVGDDGIAYVIVGLWIYCISLAALFLGAGGFEVSRKFSKT
ncbi:hypothetical protein [Undibacterium sp. SXout20W]|uniref:hypothetical protein n=1 Tax=Undibacterium sp. SXout20W TaxID=3413051 RepID=UPI003BF02451